MEKWGSQVTCCEGKDKRQQNKLLFSGARSGISVFKRSNIRSAANEIIIDAGDENPAVNVRAGGEKREISANRVHQARWILMAVAFQTGRGAQLGNGLVIDIFPFEM